MCHSSLKNHKLTGLLSPYSYCCLVPVPVPVPVLFVAKIRLPLPYQRAPICSFGRQDPILATFARKDLMCGEFRSHQLWSLCRHSHSSTRPNYLRLTRNRPSSSPLRRCGFHPGCNSLCLSICALPPKSLAFGASVIDSKMLLDLLRLLTGSCGRWAYLNSCYFFLKWGSKCSLLARPIISG